MRILSIDPGNTESGWCIIDAVTCAPVAVGKEANGVLRDKMVGSADWLPYFDTCVIEMVRSYGMPVGAEVFETCVWIGRFVELLSPTHHSLGPGPALVYRGDVKLHHCHSSRAKDANIVQALIDRFAPGEPNHGKGTKSAPGWFYGFKADVWQAYALAVYAADRLGPSDYQELE